jgi:hypothetical protein
MEVYRRYLIARYRLPAAKQPDLYVVTGTTLELQTLDTVDL